MISRLLAQRPVDRRFLTDSWDRPDRGGFTLLELLIVIGLIAFIFALVGSALAKTGPDTKTMRCLNNLRQVTRAWSTYAADNSERVANNFGVNDTALEI